MDSQKLDLRQFELAELDKSEWDVVVVGAGPSGSAAARQLAHNGHDVLLIDKAAFPRRKVCGDGLIADSIRFLKSEGLYDRVASEANHSDAATIISPSGDTFDCPGRYMVLKRERFDALMVQAAIEFGATFARGQITTLGYDQDGVVRLGNRDGSPSIRGRYCVLASGGQLSLAEQAGLKQASLTVNARPHAFAMSRYLRSSYELPNLIIKFDRRIIPGFAWVWPMGDGLFNVGAGATYRTGPKPGKLAGEALESMINETEFGRGLLNQGEFVSDLKGAPILCDMGGCEMWDQRRIVVCGEAIGTTYSLTGEGVGKAMESGKIAGEVIFEALRETDPTRLSQYPLRVNKHLRGKYRNYRIAENLFAKAWLNDFLCRRLGRSPYLLRKFTKLTDDRLSVNPFFGLGSLFKSFLT